MMGNAAPVRVRLQPYGTSRGPSTSTARTEEDGDGGQEVRHVRHEPHEGAGGEVEHPHHGQGGTMHQAAPKRLQRLPPP